MAQGKDNMIIITTLQRLGFLHGSTRKRLEGVIAYSAFRSCWYVQNILGRQRFPLGEPVIAKHPSHASWYAVNIIKGVWPEAERAIASELDASRYYYSHIIDPGYIGPWRVDRVKVWRKEHGADIP